MRLNYLKIKESVFCGMKNKKNGFSLVTIQLQSSIPGDVNFMCLFEPNNPATSNIEAQQLLEA